VWAVAFPQLHTCSFECIADGSRREAILLADGSEGVLVRIGLLRLLGEFRGQLLAGAQGRRCLVMVWRSVLSWRAIV